MSPFPTHKPYMAQATVAKGNPAARIVTYLGVDQKVRDRMTIAWKTTQKKGWICSNHLEKLLAQTGGVQHGSSPPPSGHFHHRRSRAQGLEQKGSAESRDNGAQDADAQTHREASGVEALLRLGGLVDACVEVDGSSGHRAADQVQQIRHGTCWAQSCQLHRPRTAADKGGING